MSQPNVLHPDEAAQSSPNGAEQEGRSPAEWITFGVATLVLAGVVGLIGYLWATQTQEPPELAVNQNAALWQAGGQFYIPFEVTNTGGETAEAVHIMAELRLNNTPIETGEQEIDFLSPNEKEAGAFIFEHDPRNGELTLRVTSYKAP